MTRPVRLMTRLVRLMLGWYSPSRALVMQHQVAYAKSLGLPPPSLSWLDRWELRNAERS